MIISIGSGKGGSGKSNSSVNLSIVLSNLGKKVLLIDGDFGLPNAHLLLGISTNKDIKDFIETENVDDIIVNYYGIDFIAGSTQIKDIDKPTENALINKIKSIENKYDYVIIDTAPGIAENVMFLLLNSDKVIVIVNNEMTGIVDAYYLMKNVILQNKEIPISILMNQCNEKEATKKAGRIIKNCDNFLKKEIEYLGNLEFSQNVKKAINEQIPFYIANPNFKVSKQLFEIGKEIIL